MDCSDDVEIKINEHLYSYLHTLIISDVTINESSEHNKCSASDESRMELDSHVNMPVVEKMLIYCPIQDVHVM